MGQAARKFEKDIVRHVTLEYWLHLPEGHDTQPEKEWPLIVFLHGAGERGSDLDLVKKHGIAKVADGDPSFPFITVSPQCPARDWWSNLTPALSLLLDELVASLRVDTSRIYLTGLSMGGYGSWQWAAEEPERFAAVVPICGGGDTEFAPRLAALPIWAFHGAKDPVVRLAESEEMVDAVNEAGGRAKLTVYPEADHDSWTETYENPELYAWLLSHRRS